MSDIVALRSFLSSGVADTVNHTTPTVVNMMGEPVSEVDSKDMARKRSEKQLEATFNPAPLTAVRKHGPEGFAIEVTLPRVSIGEREKLIREALTSEKTSMRARAYVVQVLLDSSLKLPATFVAEMVEIAIADPSWRVRREAQRTKKHLDLA